MTTPRSGDPGRSAPGPAAVGAGPDHRRWESAGEPLEPERLRVSIADPASPTPAELSAVRAHCRRHQMCLYRTDPQAAEPAALSRLAAALGLVRRDHTMETDAEGVAAIRVDPARRAAGFIHYSERALNWHTDGYYLVPPARVRGVLMHCARPGEEGGETELLDPRAVYLALEALDARFPAALARDDAFTIPAHEGDGEVIRPAVSGPVFSIEPPDGALHMRYTARTRSIEWCPDPLVEEARAALREAIAEVPGGRLQVCLAAGEGVVCNNVLHRRSAYRDPAPPAAGRLLYRIRSLDRVGGG